MMFFTRKQLGFLVLSLCTLASSFKAEAQACGPERYKSRVFSSIQIYRDVVYSRAAPKIIAAGLGLEGVAARDLKVDVFMPPPTDTLRQRPLVILAHGGGFVDIAFMGGTILVGTKENQDIQALCDSLAHRGFVAASVEYRTGFDVLSTTSIMRAVWRGAQDMSAVQRFFRHNASWFGIDPQRVFIGGSSAGAFASLHATFVDDAERIPQSFRQGVGMDDLGAMHSRPVVELTGFNPFVGNNVAGDQVDSLPLALVAFWGAIGDTEWFKGPNVRPVQFFHGTNDPVVDAECGKPFSGIVFAAPDVCGSIVMDSAMTALNLPHQTQIELGEGHEYWGVTNGQWGSAGPNNFWLPMIEQTIDFFYHYMKPPAPQWQQIQDTVNLNQTYTFSVQAPANARSYCWEVQNATIVGPSQGSMINLRFDQIGLALVRVRYFDGAEVRSFDLSQNILVQLPSQITALEASMPLRVFPNPAKDQVQLGGLDPSQSSQIALYNALGQMLAQWQVQGQELYQVQLPAQLSAGLYWLEVQDAKQGRRNLSLQLKP